MSLRVVQAGSGTPRPLVLIYKVDVAYDSAFISNTPSSVAIVNDTGPSMVGYYDTVPALSVTVGRLEQQLQTKLSPIIVAGFSEGGFATRRILMLGGSISPDAIVLADATYGTDVSAWQSFAAKAAHNNGVFVASHSSNVFMEPARPSPWRNLRTITGLNLPLGSGPGVEPRPIDAPVTTKPVWTSTGNVFVRSYPDLDHGAQGRVVLPTVLIPKALSLLSSSSSNFFGKVVLVIGSMATVGYLVWRASRRKV